MVLIDINGKRVEARIVPNRGIKMSRKQGRTWDSLGREFDIDIDGQRIGCSADTTWGRCAYFEYDSTGDGPGRWYTIPVQRAGESFTRDLSKEIR